jgi:hypothetical protein
VPPLIFIGLKCIFCVVSREYLHICRPKGERFSFSEKIFYIFFITISQYVQVLTKLSIVFRSYLSPCIHLIVLTHRLRMIFTFLVLFQVTYKALFVSFRGSFPPKLLHIPPKTLGRTPVHFLGGLASRPKEGLALCTLRFYVAPLFLAKK